MGYCSYVCSFFFFKQKTAYEMRISDWSSDVCSSDLRQALAQVGLDHLALGKVGIPHLLGMDRRLLAQRGKGDLAAAILDPLAPHLFRHEARRLQRGVEDRKSVV